MELLNFLKQVPLPILILVILVLIIVTIVIAIQYMKAERFRRNPRRCISADPES